MSSPQYTSSSHPAYPSSITIRRAGYGLAILGGVCGGVFGIVFRELALRFRDAGPLLTVQEVDELTDAMIRDIHPALFICGFAGLGLIVLGSFIVVRAKQLHPYWVFAGLLSFPGIIILAKLPEGNCPRTMNEAIGEIRSLLKRIKVLFLFGVVVAILVSVAWASIFLDWANET